MGLAQRVGELQQQLAQRPLPILTQTVGAELVNGRLQMNVWGTAVTIPATDFIPRNAATGGELDLLTQALIAYYLHTSDGTPPANRWIAFTELPDGRFYTQAFQGYTGRELADLFGNDVAWFGATATALGGKLASIGDAAYWFQVLPHVPLAVVCWQGDEDFPPSYKILFDAHTHHHLPTDAGAILGSQLTRKLKR